MNLVIQIIFVAIFTLLGAYFSDKLAEKYVFLKNYVHVITAITALASTYFSNLIIEKYSDPEPKVTVNVNEKEIDLMILEKKKVDAFSIQLPVKGQIIDIRNDNYISDADFVKKIIWGPNTENSANRLELLINNVIPDKEITFKIFYNPLGGQTQLVGFDTYKYSYFWTYDGNQKVNTVQKDIHTNIKTEAQGAETFFYKEYNRALSPEEVDSLYKKNQNK